MQFLSANFVILWVISFALYYLVPKKRQWVILAVASGLFYVAGTGGLPIGLLLTGAGGYACGLYLKRSLGAQKTALSVLADKERKKAALLFLLAITFLSAALLCVLFVLTNALLRLIHIYP